MTERSDRIRLPAAEPRCNTAQPAQAAARCARFKAAIPTQGAALEDYSRHAGCHPLCVGYVSIGALMDQPAPVSKPRVFKGF